MKLVLCIGSKRNGFTYKGLSNSVTVEVKSPKAKEGVRPSTIKGPRRVAR